MSAGRLEHDWFPRPLPDNVTIGARSWLYSSYAFLHCRSRRPCSVRIGQDCGVYNGSFFELGPEGEVVIGDYCTVVGAIIATNGRVEIGDYSFIAHEVVLADEAWARPFAAAGEPAARAASPPIRLGEAVWIGARAVVLAGADIGAGSIVGAAAVVGGVVPPRSVVAGNPARVVGRVGKADA
jgi:acetyltransferase-like isoleucine patch superfamily enzyme